MSVAQVDGLDTLILFKNAYLSSLHAVAHNDEFEEDMGDIGASAWTVSSLVCLGFLIMEEIVPGNSFF